MIISLVILVALIIVAYILFVNFNPGFGGDVSKERTKMYFPSKQYEHGKFVNENRNVPRENSFVDILKIARKFFFEKVENGRPDKDLIVQKVDSLEVSNYNSKARLIWFGHSAFLLQIDNKNILIDPMLSDVPAPHPWLGASRFSKELPIKIEQLPKIDAIIISHDHYDHLDYESIKKLKDKTEAYFVPLGVGVHLEAWGIESNQIQELDWWKETSFKDLNLACTPAQHFSGRKFNNGQSTLWSSWVIKSDSTNIYFSGDGGYGKHFSEIGEKYGPFDLALLECGQYNEKWSEIHMFPEQTAQAGQDVRAKAIMPIHWGAFKLALHSWTDPVERVTKKADELNIPIITPQIGTPIIISENGKSSEIWWK